jgi:hypothetical protein
LRLIGAIRLPIYAQNITLLLHHSDNAGISC